MSELSTGSVCGGPPPVTAISMSVLATSVSDMTDRCPPGGVSFVVWSELACLPRMRLTVGVDDGERLSCRSWDGTNDRAEVCSVLSMPRD